MKKPKTRVEQTTISHISKAGGKIHSSKKKSSATAVTQFISEGEDLSSWVYEPALEDTKKMIFQDRYELFIDGKWQRPQSSKYLDVINPGREEKLAEAACAGEADVNDAVEAARRAYENVWRKLAGKERAKYIYRLARVLQEKANEFSAVESMNVGKPIKESRNVDLPLACAYFFYYAGWADKLAYAFHGRRCSPLGVTTLFPSWNSPILTAACKLGLALATGNTVVLKPAETTPLTALFLARMIEEVGLPPGVVNVVTGDVETQSKLASHPGVDKVSFTGSTQRGKQLLQLVSASKKRVTMQLGGPVTNLVFADAPLDQTIEGIVSGAFMRHGRTAFSSSKLWVEESVFDDVVTKIKRRMKGLRVGDPLDKNTDVGAIHSMSQQREIQKWVAQAEEQGAEKFDVAMTFPQRGFYFSPAMFTSISEGSHLAREECLGPLLCVFSFRSYEEAIEKVNNTVFGSALGVWTSTRSKVFDLANKAKAGVIWANAYGKLDPCSAFGAYKESGLGPEGGMQALSSYLDLEDTGGDGV